MIITIVSIKTIRVNSKGLIHLLEEVGKRKKTLVNGNFTEESARESRSLQA
jgi:hypothetical protein